MKARTKSGQLVEVDMRWGIYVATHNPRRRGWIRAAGRIVLDTSEHGGYGPSPRRVVDQCLVPGYERFVGREVNAQLLDEVCGEQS
jgi:hypothetical protein